MSSSAPSAQSWEILKKGPSLRILIVDDDAVCRKILKAALVRLGHSVIEANDGQQGLAVLEKEAVRVIVSDWMMPGVDGLEFCRRVRARPKAEYAYFILLTARTPDLENQREAVEAGVDDFLTKPVDVQEIWMRLRVAERILRFATQVQQLEAFLPICAYCKKVRDDQNYWTQIESYLNERTGSEFSHSICPDCYAKVVLPELEALKKKKEKPVAEKVDPAP